MRGQFLSHWLNRRTHKMPSSIPLRKCVMNKIKLDIDFLFGFKNFKSSYYLINEYLSVYLKYLYSSCVLLLIKKLAWLLQRTFSVVFQLKLGILRLIWTASNTFFLAVIKISPVSSISATLCYTINELVHFISSMLWGIHLPSPRAS